MTAGRAIIGGVLILCAALAAPALGRPPRIIDVSKVPSAPAVARESATVDTVYLLGGPSRTDGKFQTPGGLPDDQGWFPSTRFDPSTTHWHVDTVNAALLDPTHQPNHAMWCGKMYDGSLGPGYGDNWSEALAWSAQVPDTSLVATLDLTGRLNHDLEPSYDFLYLQIQRPSGWETVATYSGNNKVDGVFVPVDVTLKLGVAPGQYVGPEANEVHLRWLVQTDGYVSDADSVLDTEGAAQLDDLHVVLEQDAPVIETFDDFEPGSALHWAPAATGSELCNFAHVWPLLADRDPLHTNNTPQLAFVDHPSICGAPGTKGTLYTYGPDGYVIHDSWSDPPPYHFKDEMWSPPIAWPGSAYTGAILAFDCYLDTPFDTPVGGPIQYAMWAIRASTDGGLSWSRWRDYGYAYVAITPKYSRSTQNISKLLAHGLTHLQIALSLFRPLMPPDDSAYYTPAPYYDNVSLAAFSSATAVPAADGSLAVRNYPNPFNPRTTISYALSRSTHVTLAIYDQRGRLVRTLVNGAMPAGEQSAAWDGQDSRGRPTPSGTYIVRLVTEQGTRVSKVALAR